MLFLGVDTSCYTTSAALMDETGKVLHDARLPLAVEKDKRGLRQSEMVFMHVKNLPAVFPDKLPPLAAVGASVRPCDFAGSYMPVFKVSEGFGRVAASSAGAYFYAFTHQQGHIGAALLGFSPNSLPEEMLALHVSGGTTDVLKIRLKKGYPEEILLLGSASDITAGQFIDRVGVKLGCSFPAGNELSALAEKGMPDRLSVSVKEFSASFSGAETAMAKKIDGGMRKEDCAATVLDAAARTLLKLIENDCEKLPVLLFGGVMRSGYIRGFLKNFLGERAYLADADYASDNACGLAYLAMKKYLSEEK